MVFTAVCMNIVGAFLLALNIEASWLGYWFFLAGSLGWMTVTLWREDPAFIMWVVFTIVNIIGIVRWTPVSFWLG